jgi:hypothetical protein
LLNKYLYDVINDTIFFLQKTSFHRCQTLGYRNGYAVIQRPTFGIGGDRLQVNQLSQAELEELANKAPILTYGQPRQAPRTDFVPAHVAFDKKVSSGVLGYPLNSDV